MASCFMNWSGPSATLTGCMSPGNVSILPLAAQKIQPYGSSFSSGTLLAGPEAWCWKMWGLMSCLALALSRQPAVSTATQWALSSDSLHTNIVAVFGYNLLCETLTPWSVVSKTRGRLTHECMATTVPRTDTIAAN